jgi:hypothetical protein
MATKSNTPSPLLSKVWVAQSRRFESELLVPQEIQFKNPTGYYGASRYAKHKWGADCEVHLPGHT